MWITRQESRLHGSHAILAWSWPGRGNMPRRQESRLHGSHAILA